MNYSKAYKKVNQVIEKGRKKMGKIKNKKISEERDEEQKNKKLKMVGKEIEKVSRKTNNYSDMKVNRYQPLSSIIEDSDVEEMQEGNEEQTISEKNETNNTQKKL